MKLQRQQQHLFLVEIFHWLPRFILALLMLLAVGCGGGSDDDDDGDSDSAATENSGGDASNSDGADDSDPNARPGLARIRVCSEAGGPVTVSVNGDTLENNRVNPGGELFINTVLGRVTFNATAEGVTFMPVTVDMVRAEGDRAQDINLACAVTGDARSSTPDADDGDGPRDAEEPDGGDEVDGDGTDGGGAPPTVLPPGRLPEDAIRPPVDLSPDIPDIPDLRS